MRLTLKIDFEGNPYIEVFTASSSDDTLDSLLELFIRRGFDEGLAIINESDLDSCTNYASIRLGSSPDRDLGDMEEEDE